MDKQIKKLLLIFTVLVLVKSLLSYFIPSPSMFGDEYTFAKMAQSIFNEGSFSIHGFPTDKEPPLYPIILSLAYIFKDMTLVYTFMKIINSILSSLIIFPAYFLTKEFLGDKKSLLASILIGVMPFSFVFPSIIMAENIYYTLILASLFFIYKSFTAKGYKYDILAGLFIGLSLLTKVIGTFIFLPMLIVFTYKLFKKDFYEIGKKTVMGLIFILTVLPWQLRNISLFGFSFETLVGNPGGNVVKINSSFGFFKGLDFLSWNLLYLGFLILGTAVIFFMMNFLIKKDNLTENHKIFYLLSLGSIISIILIVSNLSLDVFMFETLFPWLTDRPVGRYIDVVLPLIIIGGVIAYEKNNGRFKKIATFTSLILLFSSQLILFPLFPINNLSLTWIGVSKYIVEFLIFEKTSFETVFSSVSLIIFAVLFLIAPFLIYLIYKRLDLKKIIYVFMAFFIATSLIGYATVYFNADKFWYDSDEMQLGLWFNDFDKGQSKVLIDSKYGGKITKAARENLYFGSKGRSFTIVGFFMNNKIKVGDESYFEEFDYFITKDKLESPAIKEINNLRIYNIRELN